MGFVTESKIFDPYVTYLNEEWSVVWLLNSLETRSAEQAIYVKGSIPDLSQKPIPLVSGLVKSYSRYWPRNKLLTH